MEKISKNVLLDIIVKCYMNIPDTINLLKTCKSLYKFRNEAAGILLKKFYEFAENHLILGSKIETIKFYYNLFKDDSHGLSITNTGLVIKKGSNVFVKNLKSIQYDMGRTSYILINNMKFMKLHFRADHKTFIFEITEIVKRKVDYGGQSTQNYYSGKYIIPEDGNFDAKIVAIEDVSIKQLNSVKFTDQIIRCKHTTIDSKSF